MRNESSTAGLLRVLCVAALALTFSAGSPCLDAEKSVVPDVQETDVDDGGAGQDTLGDDSEATEEGDPVAACFQPPIRSRCNHRDPGACPRDRPLCCDIMNADFIVGCCCADETCGGNAVNPEARGDTYRCREVPWDFIETGCTEGADCPPEMPYCCLTDPAVCADHALVGWYCLANTCSSYADCPSGAPHCCTPVGGSPNVCTNRPESGWWGCSSPA